VLHDDGNDIALFIELDEELIFVDFNILGLTDIPSGTIY